MKNPTALIAVALAFLIAPMIAGAADGGKGAALKQKRIAEREAFKASLAGKSPEERRKILDERKSNRKAGLKAAAQERRAKRAAERAQRQAAKEKGPKP